jgi:hypothetical protein
MEKKWKRVKVYNARLALIMFYNARQVLNTRTTRKQRVKKTIPNASRKKKKKRGDTMKNIAICSVNFSISFFSPVKPQPKKIIVEDYAIEKKKKKRKRKNSPLFILLSRVLFIINEEDTRRLKIAMRLLFSLLFDRA